MAPEAVEPLRINKATPTSSPAKMPAASATRALQEISPMGIRRNSPSYGQTTAKNTTTTVDSSPFEASPRSFWQSRESASPSRIPVSENSPLRDAGHSLQRKSSLENLQKASRVSKSSMFAREHEQDYDPESPAVIERPLASGRPLSVQYSGNAFGGNKFETMGSQRASFKGHRRNESQTNIPSPTRQSFDPKRPLSPSKDQASPQKSSFSNNNQYAQNEEGDFVSDDEMQDRAPTPRQQLRPVKSVTFDAAPPQVNEYEMITPDPSSVASGSREGSYDSDPYDLDESFERPDSEEREDSFDESLEDADKTPVVLPEDWRFMNPGAANTDLAQSFDDPFNGEQKTTQDEDDLARSGSVDSNGNLRPLPPLPNGKVASSDATQQSPPRPSSSGRSPRSLPTPPPPASLSKAEILGMRESPMSLSERLRLMALQEENSAGKRAKDSLDLEREKKIAEADLDQVDEKHDSTGKEEYQSPPKISRESILRSMQGQQLEEDEFSAFHYKPGQKIDYANLDPDVPIPSRESSSSHFDDGTGVLVRRDEVERVIDRYSISRDDIKLESSPAFLDDFNRESSVIHHDTSEVALEYTPDFETTHDDAQTSMIGETPLDEPVNSVENFDSENAEDDLPPPVPEKDTPEPEFGVTKTWEPGRMSLPEFTTFGDDDFGLGLRSYMSQSPPDNIGLSKNEVEPVKRDLQLTPTPHAYQKDLTPKSIEDLQPWQTVEKSAFEEEVKTPDSVIHNPFDEEESIHESLVVPEPVATIKAPGGKLKTRPSATPADLEAMAIARREVSGGSIPSIPEGQEVISTPNHPEMTAEASGKGGRQSEGLLDIPLASGSELELGVGEEFDRLLEAQKVQSTHFILSQKSGSAELLPGQPFSFHSSFTDPYTRKQRGYLMRQNTKVIVANSRNVSNESKGSNKSGETTETSRPSSQAQTKTAGTEKSKDQILKTEPWNGRIRRQSTRRSNIMPDKGLLFGPAPPLPGQESAVDTTSNDYSAGPGEELESGMERGRLFVKVVGVKDLELPLPKKERCNFQLTLDNGLHCVTTTWMELGRTAPIGQEFELVVFDDLEFQLTLQTKLERPQSQASSTKSSAKSLKTQQQKQSALSRLLTSPKKRREMEKKQKEEEAQAALERQREMEAHRVNIEPTAWDLQHELVGPDGSFARGYVSLSNHEQQAYGRSLTVDIPCFNEWAVEDKAISNSTNSKLGGVQRRPPYKIAKMELQLLYIPKPKGVKDDDMPRSMAAAIKQMKEAETTTPQYFEGHLSQQGGDCPYWRRRFFKLQGPKLTAYHETTRQPRVSISLLKAVKLLDDKTTAAKRAEQSPAKAGKGRRQSALVEEDEAYTFLEEGFRIRFANGEVIDFYADTKEEKDAWMKALSGVVGKDNGDKQTWMSAVLAREKALKQRGQASTAEKTATTRGGSKSAPTSPQKSRRMSNAPVGGANRSSANEHKPHPVEKSPRHGGKDDGTTTAKTATTPSKPVYSSPQKNSSPAKQTSSSANTSPLKSKQSSGLPTPRLTKQNGKRQGVRSMIF